MKRRGFFAMLGAAMAAMAVPFANAGSALWSAGVSGIKGAFIPNQREHVVYEAAWCEVCDRKRERGGACPKHGYMGRFING